MVIDRTIVDSWLPNQLVRRTHLLLEAEVGEGPVVYWMHRALRVEENPALEVAVAASLALGKPLALVAELSTQRDPFASARHWTFELEGLVALKQQIERNGGHLSVIIENDHEAGSKYKRILGAAGLLVVEELPVASERAFRDLLVKEATVPILAVDASCTIPMQLSQKTIRRAFVFRERYKDEIDSVIWAAEPDSIDLESLEWSKLSLGVEDLNLSDIENLVAAAPVDHDVGPIGQLRGGRVAGVKRWKSFVEGHGLKRYAKRRNDALLDDGVSRMSAYLHYGFVSAFELARWARTSDKYIDELIVWRELAWHYCHRVPEHDQVECLPDWAQRSLRENLAASQDAPGFHALWNGETEDTFWNACQRSLRVTGELHNNVRMTWGKALVSWASSPEQALHWLTELNHRLALDGNDPASYGGLLWCLGEFDRPFKPGKPGWGEVRDRSTDVHAKRCPPMGLDELTAHRNTYHGQRVGIIGAGVAGLSAAATLRAHGVDVTVWDKGYNPGGRVARRPTDDGGAIEHGTYRFRIDGADLQAQRFREACKAWCEGGLLREEQDRSNAFSGGGNLQGWLRAIGGNLQICQKSHVSKLESEGKRVRVYGVDESFGDFDAVLSTVPGPQMTALVEGPLVAELRPLDEIAYSPSIVFAAAWPRGTQPSVAQLQDWVGGGHVVEQQGPLGLSTWAIEASTHWSTEKLENSKDELAEWFRAQAKEAGYDAPTILWAHRWKYARVTRPLGKAFWAARDLPLFWAGDGALGSGIEGAWLSGQRAATAVLARLRITTAEG